MSDETVSEFASELGVSTEAVSAARSSHLIDLHIDTFIPVRLWNYDIEKRHDLGTLRGRFGGHLDLPRIKEGGLSGAMWSVTTNPFRSKTGRYKTVQKNFKRMRKMIAKTNGKIEIVSSVQDYRRVVSEGRHACLFAIQGGNALDGVSDAGHSDWLIDPDLTRVTLVHLTNSTVGESSSPYQAVPQRGLTDVGRSLIERLNEHRVVVDLAHIGKEAFWQAMEIHDSTQPVMVTHTGVEAVTDSWRNLDNKQIRAVVDTGGVVGIMFHTPFISRRGPQDCSMVIDHIEHVINIAGEEAVSLGSDYDGAITPPKDLRSGNSYPRLVQEMLQRNWSTSRIENVLGENFLRSWARLRP